METKESNRKALQSETWKDVKKAMKEKQEIPHFTTTPSMENGYGKWCPVVDEYLMKCYKSELKQNEIALDGTTYLVLKRDNVTVFYDAEGNTLFDVLNTRLEMEYKWLLNNEKEGNKKEKAREQEITKSSNQEKITKMASIQEISPENNKMDEKVVEDEKRYLSGAKKIKDEVEKEYKLAKGKEAEEVMKRQMDPIVKYISEKCESDSKYNAMVIQEHKTWKHCYEFMMKKAKAMATQGSTGLLVEGNTILHWIDEYYKKEEKAEVEPEKREKERKTEQPSRKHKLPLQKQEKSESEVQKKGSEKNYTKKAIAEPNQNLEPKKNEMSGQLSPFDF